MVVTTNIRLERILLHSRATSISRFGMDNMIPSCVTGTPIAWNRIRAADADCCCKNSTIQFSARLGMGMIKNRKQRGKIKDRTVLAPKHKTTLAIHQVTRENMLSDSRTSSGAARMAQRPKKFIARARLNRTAPVRGLG